MSVWVECLVSIRFDLDIGPTVEYVTPPDALTKEGKQHLLRVAFPDCNPDCGHDFIFFFTTTDCTAVADAIHSATVADPSHGSAVSKIHGAAYYRQKRDPNVPRGYVQQVVVLLSRVPYLVAHELILRVVVPRFAQCCPLSPDTTPVAVASALSPAPSTFFALDMAFNPSHYTQAQVLDEAVAEIAKWPSPHPRVRYDVMLLHQPLVFTTPSRALRSSARAQQNAVRRPPMMLDERVRLLDRDVLDATDSSLCSASMAVPLVGVLGTVLHYLTRLWELVISHEPLFIIANTPSTASGVAVAVASLVLPITFTGVLRAYFTVQDEFFSRFSRMGKALPFPQDESLIVAGTNPFLIRSFEGWPTLLAVSDHYANVTGSFRGLGDGAGGDDSIGHSRLAASTTAAATGVDDDVTSPVSLPQARSPTSSAEGPSPSAGPSMATRSSSFAAHAGLSLRTSGNGESEHSLAADSPSQEECDADLQEAASATAAMLGLPYGCALPAAPRATGTSPTRSPAASSPLPPPFSPSLSTSSEPLHADPTQGTTIAVPLSQRALLNTDVEGSDPLHVDASPATPQGAAATGEGIGSPLGHSAASSTAGYPTKRDATASAGNSSIINGGTTRLSAPPSASLEADTSAGVSSPVFSQASFSVLEASRRMAGQSSIAKSNPATSRAKLQHHLRNYLDSSYSFILDHESQTSALYKRLEAVSKMDEEAQRTSSQLLSERFVTATTPSGATSSAPHSPAGGSRRGSMPSSPAPAPQTPAPHGLPSHDPAAERAQFLVADDVVRKFFISLTREFLSPVATWFASVTAHITAFHLCDRSFADVQLSGEKFLQYFAQHHRDVAPHLVRKTHHYKSYKVIYEKFAHGKLFVEYMHQLVQERLRTEMNFFQVEDWAARFPTEPERVDMFINLYNVVKRELELCIDPDVILVTTATAVLASMAVFIGEPLRDQLMMKIGDLRL